MSSLAPLLPPTPQRAYLYGLAVGIVTNNKDPEGLGRVKVRFPWLSDEAESHWARVATPMAGKERGLYFLPEVDDEVLLAFEHGSVEFPYVIGALWNGKDKPPVSNSDGKNNQRALVSRSGHTIVLDDTSGEECIIIEDKSGKNSIIINTKDNSITITAGGDVTLKAGGKLSLSGKGVEIVSTDAMTLKASKNLDASAGPQMNLKGKMININ